MSREPYDPIESCASSLRDIRDDLDALVGALVPPAGVTLAPRPDDACIHCVNTGHTSAWHEAHYPFHSLLDSRPAPDALPDRGDPENPYLKGTTAWVVFEQGVLAAKLNPTPPDALDDAEALAEEENGTPPLLKARPAPDAALIAERDALADDEQSAWESYEALREAARAVVKGWETNGWAADLDGDVAALRAALDADTSEGEPA